LTNLTIGYLSPGWPLKACPNGIVAYVDNLLSGFNSDVNPIILANQSENLSGNNIIVDLSQIAINKGVLNKIIDKFCFSIQTTQTVDMRLRRRCEITSERILTAINGLENELDLLEVEESFGMAYWLKKKTNTKIITRLHGPWFLVGTQLKVNDDPEFRHRIRYEGLAIQSSDGVTVPSANVLNMVRDYYNLELPDAAVIPNPVRKVSENLRWSHNSTNDRRFLLYIGRFDLTKGGDLVLQAFRIIAQTNPDIELYFAGPDRGIKLENTKYFFEDFKNKIIPEEHIKKRIIYYNHISPEQISELRRLSLITIIASRYETFCIALVEALMAGCPVVATASGAITEIIIDGFNGLLAESGSAESIAEKVLNLMENKQLQLILSENAIKDGENKYAPEKLAEQSVAYYKTLLNS
jgi:glycosyltransferase involved in cell wall biosynthesis